MGLGPISAIYQARYNRYLQNRGLLDTSGSRVWAFLGDGETDEPESLGALHVASREGLDNLTFVVNCNLQRLDGPVRGNGKIIQELEAAFRGAGWNVIKVIWGREWDELLARDVDGVLVQKMNETLDGEFQKFSVAGGAYIREHFFGPDPRLRKMVEHLSDDDLAKLRRGGHDYRKVYAAYKAATEHQGAPTVILAKTVKGWTLGPGRRSPQHHPPGQEAERGGAADLPRPPGAADPGRHAQGRALLPPGSGLRGGRVPARTARRPGRPSPATGRASRAVAGAGPRGRCRVRGRQRHPGLDDDGLRPDPAQPDPRSGARPTDRADHPRTRPAPSGWTRCSRRSGSIRRSASATSRSTRTWSCPTARRPTARSSRRGSPRRVRWPASRPRTDVRHPRPGDHPVLHLLLDVRVPADRRPDVGARRRARARVPDGRHGRPNHADRRGPPARRRPDPDHRLDHPEPARLRPGLRVRAGRRRPRRDRADVRAGRGRLLLHHDLQRELRPAAQAGGRGRGPAARDLPVLGGAQGSARTPIPRGSSVRARSSSRSWPPATCWPNGSASPPRSTAPRRSRCSVAMPSRSSAGTGSTPTRSRCACRTSARSCRTRVARSSPPPTG